MEPSARKRRPGVTVAQRRAIRQQAKKNPAWSQKDLQQWFNTQYERTIAQPTVSEALSTKYKHLDNNPGFPNDEYKQRDRGAQWSELEKALFEWYIEYEFSASAPITGDLLKATATNFWRRLPKYRDMEIPVFSNGWLQGFKQRHHVKSRRPFEFAVESENANAEQIAAVKAIASHFPAEDCYNCDETILFFKRLPDESLSSDQSMVKSKLTALFCCNADGSHKLPIWFVGKHARPRSFAAANIQTSALDVVWRSNTKAWMTPEIMAEWLRWFSAQIGTRRVLLIMDSIHTHSMALERVRKEQALGNITVVWLPEPKHSNLKNLPLELGIIRAFKVFYRKRWLEHILAEFQAERPPTKTMNVLKAIRWSTRAWQAVTPRTIQQCWNQSGLKQGLGPVNAEIDDSSTPIIEMSEIVQHLWRQGRIATGISMATFLDPPEEAFTNTDDDLVELIAQQFSTSEAEDDESEDSDDEEPYPTISQTEAQQSLNTLRLYLLQQPDGDPKLVSFLDQQEQIMKKENLSNNVLNHSQTQSRSPNQTQIAGFFS